ncbi:MAG: LysM peptidoglycan-binding domain-containing protein [Chloroflexaceae bacterium]|nr:LysM peptidoglycan-binding domain-containing protein [Chloroflexaceae bacterium]
MPTIRQRLRVRPKRTQRVVGLVSHGLLISTLAACTLTLPEPPEVNLPTQPAVMLITPAPTLDIDATATVMATMLRPTPTPAGLYIVQPDDTLSDIASRFGTTVEEILVANDLSDPNALQVGQRIIIPSLLPTAMVTPANATDALTNTAILTPTNALTTP